MRLTKSELEELQRRLPLDKFRQCHCDLRGTVVKVQGRLSKGPWKVLGTPSEVRELMRRNEI